MNRHHDLPPGFEIDTIEFAPAHEVRIAPGEWETRAAQVMTELGLDGVDPSAFHDVLRSFRFRDQAALLWTYNGTQWWRWDGAATWVIGEPPGSLMLQPFTMEIGAVYAPTHVAPPGGALAWASPDPHTNPVARLDPYLEVMVREQRDNGWARIVCSNGWSAWVDARLLQTVEANAMPTGVGSVRPLRAGEGQPINGDVKPDARQAR